MKFKLRLLIFCCSTPFLIGIFLVHNDIIEFSGKFTDQAEVEFPEPLIPEDEFDSSSNQLLSENFKFYEIHENGKFLDKTPNDYEIHNLDFGNPIRIKRDLANNTEINESDKTLLSDQVLKLKSRVKMDVINLHRNLTLPEDFSLNTSKFEATVEVGFVLDYKLGKLFEFDTIKILRYATVLLNAVNNIYSLMEDPEIRFVLTGIYLIAAEEAQPFIQESKNGSNYNIRKMLQSYSSWAYKNFPDLPNHDILPLLSGVTSDSSAVGLAYLSGACWIDDIGKTSMAVAVVLDTGGHFDGVFTLAHELAHNLGANHDGPPDAPSCPWANGNIMSYEGWGKAEKFQFSPCSQASMKLFIGSEEANCLRKREAETHYNETEELVGDIIDLSELCKNLTGDQFATILQTDADDYCKIIQCRIRNENGPGFITFNRPPGDNTECGINGKCILGECVNNTELLIDRLNMTKQCMKIANNSLATLFIEDDANAQCEQLMCKVPLESKGTAVTAFPFQRNGSFPCGDTGICADGKCIGSQETLESSQNLHNSCRKKTGEPSALYEDPEDEDAICKITRCKIIHTSNSTITFAIFPTSPLNGSYPCRTNGKCIDLRCIGSTEDPNDKFNLTKLCIKKTNNPLAVAHADPSVCKRLQCKIEKPNGKGWILQNFKLRPKSGSFPCGIDGKCVLGHCLESDYGLLQSLNITRMCQQKTGNSDAFVGVNSPDPNDVCQGLRCSIIIGGRQLFAKFDDPIPNYGFPCPNSGMCVNQSCIANSFHPELLVEILKNPNNVTNRSGTVLANIAAKPQLTLLSTSTSTTPAPHQIVRDDDLLNMNVMCRKQSKIQIASVSTHLNHAPNDKCKYLYCELPKPDGSGFKYRMYKGLTIPDKAYPCGYNEDGYCLNGICTNQSPDAYNMTKLCEDAEPGAELVGDDDPNDQCLEIHCRYRRQSTIRTISLGPPHNGSFPCGLGGTCIDEECIGDRSDPSIRLNLHELCKRKTGKSDAVLYTRKGTADEQCFKLRCEYPRSKSKIGISRFDEFVRNGSRPCGTGANLNGICIDGKCVH